MAGLFQARAHASEFFNAALIDFDSTENWVVVWVVFFTEWMVFLNLSAFVHCIDEIDEAIFEIFLWVFW